ncbi:tetratricopeptide repeat protein [Streptomyces anulatus]
MSVEWEAPGTSNSISGGRQDAVVMAREISGPITFTTGGRRVPGYLQDPLRWALAGEWDALAAGAHRARPDDAGDAVPPYVPRDQDTLIRTRLTRAADEGGLVLVVGDSTAGKTRACFEALRAELPEHRVVTPAGGSDLMTAVEVIDRTGARCVVWLDDLEAYLGPDGLEPGLLAELVRLRIPVLATMRYQQFEIFTAPESTPAADTEHARAATVGGRVLRQLDTVGLDRVWTAGELERAGEAEDDRIADALAHHGPYGIAEYLAAGPALFQEWHRAARPGGHPRAAALVTAAVDLARTGLRPPYPLNLLTVTHEPYLAAAGGPLLRPESLGTALEWATRRRHGVTSMLVPTQDPNAWNVFDYLTDHTHTPIPDMTWHTAFQQTADADELATMGFHAHRVAPFIAEKFYRPAAEAGRADVMNNLAVLLAAAGRFEEAERFQRRAAAAGDSDAVFNLGSLLSRTARSDEAEAAYRQAADAGHTSAMFNLGVVLGETARSDEAEAAYRQAADAGHTSAMNNLGVLMDHGGRRDEAEHTFRRAAAAGHVDAMNNLGILLAGAGRLDEAEAAYRQAVDSGDVHAMNNLGNLLARMGRPDEAEAAYRHAADSGLADAMVHLGILLENEGRPDEAEAAYRQAVGAGHTSAISNLGSLLSNAGRPGEAEAAYRRAADAGHTGAMHNLGNLLARAGRPDEAEAAYRQAADAGHTESLNNLANLLAGTGRLPEAVAVYRRAADAGHTSAMNNLGSLLNHAGRPGEAEPLLRRAADAGHINAMYNLGKLLASVGQLKEAETAYRQAADAGHPSAMNGLTVLLAEAGRTGEEEAGGSTGDAPVRSGGDYLHGCCEPARSQGPGQVRSAYGTPGVVGR